MKRRIVKKVKFEELDPNLYLTFMPAVSGIYKQDYFLEQFDFYPIGNASMTELAWDTMIHAGLLLIGMVVVINVLLWSLFRSRFGGCFAAVGDWHECAVCHW